MNHKTLFTCLLVVIFLASCTFSAVTNTAAPPKVPTAVTRTATPSPTSTVNVTLTQIERSELIKLIEPYQYAQSEDLSAIHRTLGESIIEWLWFTQDARWWSSQDKQTAQEILKLGMNPGLGVRALHAEGIAGIGVTVAIIDHPVIPEHPEFEGKIIKYRDFGTGEESDKGSMHGPAVTSLLVGENIGTAPSARVYYAAVPSWYYDAQYYADALNWIIDENEKLPDDKKIRVVSVSSIPSGIGSEYKNQDAWNTAYEGALKAGILVLDCTYEHGYTIPCTYDLHDPDNVAKCIPNWDDLTVSPHEPIYVPMSHRTTAIERNGNPIFSYQYDGLGGISWTVPYLSGVLALGWQVNPALSSSQLLDLVYASAYVTDDNQKIINPKAFIEMVKLTLDQ